MSLDLRRPSWPVAPMRNIIIASFLALAACGPEQPQATAPSAPTAPQVQPIDAVVSSERSFAADGAATGWVEAFQKWREPDAIMLGAKITPAKDALEGLATRAAGDTSLKWAPEFAGVSAGGDLGFTTGPFTDGGQNSGYYFTVWRKQADGAWKWFYDGGLGSKTPLTLPAPDASLKTVVSTNTARPSESAISAEASLAKAALTDAHAAFANLFSGNARVHRADALPGLGPEGAMALINAGPKVITFTPLQGISAQSGDMVFALGEARWQGGGGYYGRIWMHEAGGWRIVFDQIVPRQLDPK